LIEKGVFSMVITNNKTDVVFFSRRMFKNFLLVFIFELLSLSVCYAEKVLPVPTGDWYSDSAFYTMPVDFPYSNLTDYQTIVAQGNPQSEVWATDCKTQNGGIADSVTHKLFPTYQCPINSRIAVDKTTTTPTLICSTTPQVCKADVVGRDLDEFGFNVSGTL
jgi:hypothetical protein